MSALRAAWPVWFARACQGWAVQIAQMLAGWWEQLDAAQQDRLRWQIAYGDTDWQLPSAGDPHAPLARLAAEAGDRLVDPEMFMRDLGFARTGRAR